GMAGGERAGPAGRADKRRAAAVDDVDGPAYCVGGDVGDGVSPLEGVRPCCLRPYKGCVTRGLDPRVHPLRKKFLQRRWIAGSSPAMTTVIVARVALCNISCLRRRRERVAARAFGKRWCRGAGACGARVW